MGSTVLEALGDHHAAREQHAVAALCFRQAGLYAERTGQSERAAALMLSAREVAPEEPQPLIAVAEGCLNTGEIARGVEAVLAGGKDASDAASRREALRIAEAYLGHSALLEDVARSLALHELAATLCDQLDDAELAESHRARAQLMALYEVS